MADFQTPARTSSVQTPTSTAASPTTNPPVDASSVSPSEPSAPSPPRRFRQRSMTEFFIPTEVAEHIELVQQRRPRQPLAPGQQYIVTQRTVDASGTVTELEFKCGSDFEMFREQAARMTDARTIRPVARVSSGNIAPRKKYDAATKLQLGTEALLSTNQIKFWEEKGIKYSTGMKWTKNLPLYRTLKEAGDSAKQKARGVEPETADRLERCTRHYAALRESYYAINLRLLDICLGEGDPAWNSRSASSKSKFFAFWLMRNRLVVRAASGSHQLVPKDAHARVAAFYSMLEKYPPSITIVIVCDETKALYNYGSSTTVTTKGDKNVHVVAQGAVDERTGCTVHLAAISDGSNATPLQPFVIFKGGKGVLKKVKLPAENSDCLTFTTASGWQTEESMLFWIRAALPVLSPETGLIVMDLHASHRTPAVRDLLRERGYSVAYIPAGCTGVCQVHDVVVNKPFKASLRAQYSGAIAQILNLPEGERKQALERKVSTAEQRTRILQWIRKANALSPDGSICPTMLSDAIIKHVWTPLLKGRATIATDPGTASIVAESFPVEFGDEDNILNAMEEKFDALEIDAANRTAQGDMSWQDIDHRTANLKPAIRSTLIDSEDDGAQVASDDSNGYSGDEEEEDEDESGEDC